ncbi:LuxR C-terminal-related transcriptional regulator [Kribbella sp. NPDC051718]|uniref:LuxR C-terminal-related transcriptional regulator n=1 Tax=Kribbella sp. NPDC051718 TaxID=3155168 RepID=UPI00342B6F55
MADWEAVGLSGFDADLYRQLLREPGVAIAQHGEALGVPVATVEAAVARLVEVGLVRGGSEEAPAPVDPRSGVGMLVRERRAALDGVAAMTDQLAREFSAGQLRAEPSRLIEIAVGREAIEARIEDMLRGATEQAVGTDTPPYVADGSHQVSSAELALLDRGVRFRSIYASEVLDHPAWVAHLTSMAERGEQARVLPQVPLKLLIVDGTTAILPLAGDESPGSQTPPAQARAVVVTDSVLTNALQVLFDQLWRQATPLRLTESDAVDPAASLINLLASGMKDEAIARQLGVSGRTLRRRIAQVQEQLGATSRFQAGLQAARHGWR